jgi:hypothetical protein
MKMVAPTLSPDGCWLWSDFAITESGLSRLFARTVVGFLHGFFRLTSRLEAGKLVNPTTLFRETGFSALDEKLLRGGLLKSVLWRRSAGLGE